MTVLVAGADRVDAGKTTFAAGLVHDLGTTGFKPRAGNDYWFDHDDYLTAIEAGRLYGKDAATLADASKATVRAEDINPIHRLWRPAPEGDPFIGPPNRSFLLDRVGDGFVVNAEQRLPDSVQEALPLEDAPSVSTVDELNEITDTRYLPLLEDLARRIQRTEQAVVESYGDIARPIRDLALDRVAVVEPERARIYDGQRYLDACDVATGSPLDGQLEERVDTVTDLLEPLATVALPPLTKDDRKRPSRIARAYEDAYQHLRDHES